VRQQVKETAEKLHTDLVPNDSQPSRDGRLASYTQQLHSISVNHSPNPNPNPTYVF